MGGTGVTTFAIILATSEGQQFEHPTAMLEHEGGRSFLRSLALNFGRAGCRILGVVGRHAELVRNHHPDMDLVDAEEGRDDPLSAARAGIRVALEEGADRVLLHPVDMPAVRTTTLKALVKGMGEGLALRPEFEGAPGYPILLSRSLAEQLLANGEAKDLAAALLPLGVRRQPTRDPGVVVRFASAEIYERILGSAPKLAPPPRRRGRATEEAEHVT